jgi:hypothetical protein
LAKAVDICLIENYAQACLSLPEVEIELRNEEIFNYIPVVDLCKGNGWHAAIQAVLFNIPPSTQRQKLSMSLKNFGFTSQASRYQQKSFTCLERKREEKLCS